MSVEEERDLVEYNKQFENDSNKLAFEAVTNLNSIPSLSKKRLRFINYSDRTLHLFWINYDHRAIPYATIEVKQYIDITTYCGHPWVARFADTGDLCAFRLDLKPTFHSHKIYVGSRPLPPNIVERTNILIVRAQRSLLESSVHAVAALIDYDNSKIVDLDIPQILKEEVRSCIYRRRQVASPANFVTLNR